VLDALIDGVSEPLKDNSKFAILSDNGSEFKKDFDALTAAKTVNPLLDISKVS
jgi:hypothetical protein